MSEPNTPSSPPSASKRLQIYLAIAAVVLAVAGCCIVWVDLPVGERVQAADHEMRQLARPFSTIGKAEWPLVSAAVVMVIACFFRRWQLANKCAFIFFSITTTLVVHLFKLMFGRARPKLMGEVEPAGGFEWFRTIRFGSDYSDFASFPSGHSAVAGALAMSVWLVSPIWVKWPLLVLSVLIAASRVIVLAHWVSDTLVGALLGATCALLLHRYYTRKGWLDQPRGFLYWG